MEYLSVMLNEPPYNTIPVIKTKHYPWTEGSYKPLAYARLAYVVSSGLLVDIQAFERDPYCGDKDDMLNNSCVAVALNLCPEKDKVLTIVLGSDAGFVSYLNGEKIQLVLDVTSYSGEDDLGFHWGVRFYIPEKTLNKLFSVSKLENGHMIKGNIFKFKRTGSDSHFGAASPLEDDSIFSGKNLSDYIAVSY